MSPADALRLAATVILLRDGTGGLELLLLRRSGRSGFAAGAWVFPGGVVEDPDRALPASCWRGIEPAALAPRFALEPETVLGVHVAAARETFEESGLLLARTREGRPVDPAEPVLVTGRQALARRRRGHEGDAFAAWLSRTGLVLDLGGLTYFSRWVTPTLERRRYDTAFFVARAPAGQAADADRVETTARRWVAPGTALAEHRAGSLHLVYPTVRTLEELAGHPDAAAVAVHAAARPRVRRIQPHAVRTAGGGTRIIHPDEPDFPHQRNAGVPR